MTKTSIQISTEVREALGRHRLTKRETYDEVLRRLMISKRIKASKGDLNPLRSGVFATVAKDQKPLNKRIQKELGL